MRLAGMLRTAALFFLAASFICCTEGAKAQRQENSAKVANDLEEFLRQFVQGLTQRDLRYFSAFVDLNGDQRDEVIIHLVGPDMCGAAGGCMTLVVTPGPSGYRLVTDIASTSPPIRMLATSSNGWSDLAVFVLGTGRTAGYEARLTYNGATYPDDPSSSRAIRSDDPAPGRVLIPAFKTYEEGTHLRLNR